MPTAETIRFVCSSCGYRARVPSKFEGKRIKCPACKSTEQVTADDGPITGQTVAIKRLDTKSSGKDDKFRFVCGSCGYRARIPTKYDGMTIKCPGCGEAQTAKREEEETAEQPGSTVQITKVDVTAKSTEDDGRFRFQCTECGYRARLPDRFKGETVKCPGCGSAQEATELDPAVPSTGDTMVLKVIDQVSVDDEEETAEPTISAPPAIPAATPAADASLPLVAQPTAPPAANEPASAEPHIPIATPIDPQPTIPAADEPIADSNLATDAEPTIAPAPTSGEAAVAEPVQPEPTIAAAPPANAAIEASALDDTPMTEAADQSQSDSGSPDAPAAEEEEVTAESGPFEDLPLEEPYADESEMSTARRRRSVKHGTLPEMAVVDEPDNATAEQPASSIPKGARPLSGRTAAADGKAGAQGGKGLAIVLLLLLIASIGGNAWLYSELTKETERANTNHTKYTAEVDGRTQDNANWDTKYNNTVSEMTGQYNALEESKQKVETEFAETKQTLETQLDGVKNTLGTTTAKLKETSGELADKIAEATTLTTELDTTKASLTESVAKVGTLEEQVKRLDQGGRAMEAKLKTSIDERNKATAERDVLQKQIEDIKAKLKEKGIGGLLN